MEPEKKPALNKEQQAAVYCEKNSVIAAGAGAGKTLVLAKRFVWLITEKKYAVNEILTLTFTKKAATEMYRRIYLELSETASDCSGEKGKLAQKAIDEFAQARIQTLDSYSTAIVKQAANRYGISPDFSVDDERCRQLAIEEALPFVIARRSHPAIECLYHHKNPVYIANEIFAKALYNYSYIDSPPDVEHDINIQFNIICNEWKKYRKIIIDKIDEISIICRENEKLHPDIAPILHQFNKGNVAFPDEQELRNFFKQLMDIPEKNKVSWANAHSLQKAMEDTLVFFASLKDLNLNKGPKKNNPVKDFVINFRKIFNEFSSLAVYCKQAGLIYSMLILLSDLQKQYLEKKRSLGILTFSDIARLSKKILLEQHDIRYNEKETFKAIMIDEFQDNNEMQKDLLFLLAEKLDVMNNSVPQAQDLCPEKLFFVGDEKQSIYRFRGADVSVFRKLKTELGSEDLPLTVNYRSSPMLISAFNTIFGGLEYNSEGKQNDEEKSTAGFFPSVFAPQASLPLYEASYTPLQAYWKNDGKITLCILDKEDNLLDDIETDGDFGNVESESENEILSPLENEARYVAEKIKILLNTKDETGNPKYKTDDIAILFRSRSPQPLFEKHLMLLNIPYINENLTGFFFGGLVNDIMSVLRLAAYPADRAAYAQLLRSPFAGLSMAGLAVCLCAEANTAFSPGTEIPLTEIPFTEQILLLLPAEDREKYLNGKRVYEKIVEKARTANIGSLLNELWYNEGYRYETEWNTETAAYRELYDYLFHLAVKADEKNQGLAEFTDYILELEKSGERLDDIDIPLDRSITHPGGAVHIMTIHKSKGLEFPVVFICCCNKRGAYDYSEEIFSTEDAGLTLNPPLPEGINLIKDIKRNYFWERSSSEENGKRKAELRRLLYVGMTRAENELYISGCLDISKFLSLTDSNSGSNENFSTALKQYVSEKIAKKKETDGIEGDAILEGNTFFGLCLPAFASHLPENANDDSEQPFFNIEKIPVYNEQYMYKKKADCLFANNQKGLNDFFETMELNYKNTEKITTPFIPKRHISPAALFFNEKIINTENLETNAEYSGEDAFDAFIQADILINRYAKQYGENNEKFNNASFGTIAHICVESQLAGREAAIPQKFAGFLNPPDAEIFLDAGKEIARRFIRSPLGCLANKAETRKSEFPFRSLIYDGEKEFFFNGTIDLIFEDSETFYVVDFKTDSQEAPQEHLKQMACYYKAAHDLFGHPSGKACKIWLYYLRSGHAVDVTEAASEVDILV